MTFQKLRKGELISLGSMDSICRMLRCQPGDVIGFLWHEYDTFLPDETFEPKAYILDRDEDTPEFMR